MSYTLSSACPSCSLVYWKVRDAKGVIWAPKFLLLKVSNGSSGSAQELSKAAARAITTYESPLPRFLVKSILKDVLRLAVSQYGVAFALREASGKGKTMGTMMQWEDCVQLLASALIQERCHKRNVPDAGSGSSPGALQLNSCCKPATHPSCKSCGPSFATLSVDA